jgi:hypothetical protein
LGTDHAEEKTMRVLLICSALFLSGCVSTDTARADHVSYAVLTPLGQTPRAVRVEPSKAVGARDRMVLADVPLERRAAAVVGVLARARAYAQSHGLRVVGPPLLVNHLISDAAWEFEVMLPIAEPGGANAPAGGASITDAPSGYAVAMDHHGPNDTLFASYKVLSESVDSARLGTLTWEQYLTDPSTTPASEQRIRIFRALASR